jgi:hypothetical protein
VATHAGLAFFEHPRPRVWLVFACDEHRGELIAARRMLDRDRAELRRRAEVRRRAVEDGVQPAPLEPLAAGGQARRLVERARAWVSRHGTSESP